MQQWHQKFREKLEKKMNETWASLCSFLVLFLQPLQEEEAHQLVAAEEPMFSKEEDSFLCDTVLTAPSISLPVYNIIVL